MHPQTLLWRGKPIADLSTDDLVDVGVQILRNYRRAERNARRYPFGGVEEVFRCIDHWIAYQDERVARGMQAEFLMEGFFAHD